MEGLKLQNFVAIGHVILASEDMEMNTVHREVNIWPLVKKS